MALVKPKVNVKNLTLLFFQDQTCSIIYFISRMLYHIWHRGKGLDAFFGGEFLSLCLFYCWLHCLLLIQWRLYTLWNVREAGSMPLHPLHATTHPKCSPVTADATKRWGCAITHLGLWSMLFLFQGNTITLIRTRVPELYCLWLSPRSIDSWLNLFASFSPL